MRLAGPGAGVELLPGLDEGQTVVPAPQPPPLLLLLPPPQPPLLLLPPPANLEPAQPRRARPFLRALRWTGGLISLVIVGYLASVSFAVWRMEQRIVVPLPPTPTERPAVQATSRAGDSPVAVVERPTPTPDLSSALPDGRTLILVMGTDRRPNDPDHWPRSDTMILFNLDTRSKTVRAMSLPRDLVVDVPGYGPNKLNSSYLFGEYYGEPGGGKALTVRTVSQLFNVPIDYYATINFEGFRQLVDRVGGVNIDVPYALDDYNYPSDDEGDPYGMLHVHFDEGLQHMDGKTALRYVRTRHADNDFMRNKRQLQVILGVRRSAMSLDLLPALPDLIDRLAGAVETNIPFDKQMAFAQLAYRLDASSVLTSTIDRQMIIPTTLPDGTEGLKLDWEAAGPMLDEYFGIDAEDDTASFASRRVAAPTRTPTPKHAVKRKPAVATPTRTRVPKAVKSGGRP